MKRLILILFINSFLCFSQTQKLYLPLDFQRAINNGTRTNSGIPGENYWQNNSNYKINVELLPDSSYLIGDGIITYYNNSPDSLNEIVIRLYQDIFKYGATRDWFFGKNFLNDGVKINYLIINGDSLDISKNSNDIRRGSTNTIVKLNDKIFPNSKVEIKIGWEFEISRKLKMRMGNYGEGNFFIAYWYPQIAVYDDIDGWDINDYKGFVEFYNDFSDYDVTIKVPKGMVVWATGDLLNAKAVLKKDIFDKYELAKISRHYCKNNKPR